MSTAAVVEVLKAELNNGPDARSEIPDGCPFCGGNLYWDQIIEWRFYPDGNGYWVECGGCTFAQEVIL